MSEPRFRDKDGNPCPPPPPGSAPNPDWAEPRDGEIVEVIWKNGGFQKGVYNAATKQIEHSPYTFADYEHYIACDNSTKDV